MNNPSEISRKLNIKINDRYCTRYRNRKKNRGINSLQKSAKLITIMLDSPPCESSVPCFADSQQFKYYAGIMWCGVALVSI